MIVVPVACMAETISAPFSWSMWVIVEPAMIGTTNPPVNSKAWYIGRTDRNSSAANIRCVSRRAVALAMKLPCVSGTALGAMVVPDVNRIDATAFSSTGTGAGAASREAPAGGVNGRVMETSSQSASARRRARPSKVVRPAHMSLASANRAADQASAAGNCGSSGTAVSPARIAAR